VRLAHRLIWSPAVSPRDVQPASAVDLCDARFDDTFVRSLPADAVDRNVPRPVRDACFTFVTPTPVAAPELLAWSDHMGATLGLARPQGRRTRAVEVLAGNALAAGMRPYSARYGGHQFGHWAGQLGDGRAITLGELIAPDEQRWEVQLKGAGRTPYSRTADGRAVLRSSVREFLCSEAMFHLGVPTTRALSLVATGEPVVRDMFYDGHPREEPGAVVARIAPSFVRFGNFEILAAHEETALLRQLADHVIASHFPDIDAAAPDRHARWFAEICRRTAVLMAHWMRVGFVHGVMNTDNMSILGLTIDYGPYGWLEGFDPGWTPNTTDASGRRYRYGQQPQIAHWNLVQLANALYPLVEAKEPLVEGLELYRATYERSYGAILAAKLGLADLAREGDDTLVNEMFAVLQATEIDMTLFFRGLAAVPVDRSAQTVADAELLAPVRNALYAGDTVAPEILQRIAAWLRTYAARAAAEHADPVARVASMNATNPLYVLRNYLAQLAIEAAEGGDPSEIERLLAVLHHPYDEQPGCERYAEKRPEWARHKAGCSALSCSS